MKSSVFISKNKVNGKEMTNQIRNESFCGRFAEGSRFSE
jgi:hypothetical protein